MSVGGARCGAFAVAAVLALAAPASAQDQAARVKVRMPWLASMGVVGDPVEGIRLRLTNLATGETVADATGADGSFRFRDLAPGPYRLHVATGGGDPDRPITIAMRRAFLPGPRAREPREIVVVGLRTPRPDEARRVPVHTPEWTDLSDHDPGVAEGKGHEAWIELSSVALTAEEKTLLLRIPPGAWSAEPAGRYFDLYVGVDPARGYRPIRCYGCEGVTASAMEGGVVFGDGIRGSRPPRAKVAAPVRVAPPDEER